MKVLLVAVNSKFIHSNLAVRYIRDYCSEFNVSILETNINTPYLNVTSEIVLANADIVGFSTYIFNIDFIKKIVSDLRKLTSAKIVFGGPEASGNLDYATLCDHLIVGEGEKAWHDFLTNPNAADKIIYGSPLLPKDWICPNEEYLSDCKNKIIYYESSRGCPFSCSYCASGSDAYRTKNLEQVKRDLDFFCDHSISQVKFIDRTFNADLKRAKEIFRYIIEKKPETNFHMEMAPDLFDDELFAILATAKKGQFQFEIGIQTFCEKTLALINRKMNIKSAETNILKAIALGNIHIHIDLIFGLPNETLAIIKSNINKATSLNPHCLQLGFLKILGASALKRDCEKFGIVHSENAPFEILYSSTLSTKELITLRQLEKVFDYFYNDKKFTSCINLLMLSFNDYYSLFESLGDFMQATTSISAPIGLVGKTKLLHAFCLDLLKKGSFLANFEKNIAEQIIENCLRFDYLKLCSDPALKKPLTPAYPTKGKYHIQSFMCNPTNLDIIPTTIAFDYTTKKPITGTFPHSIL